MKTNVKSKRFYAEAEDMETGWGKYLKSIDKLKDAVQQQKDITLNDACWVLYGEGHCSSTWEAFRGHCIKKQWSQRKMPCEAWQGIFNSWNISKLV